MKGEIPEEPNVTINKAGEITRRPTLKQELYILLETSINWDIGSFRARLENILTNHKEDPMCREAATPPKPRREWKEYRARTVNVLAVPHPTKEAFVVIDQDGKTDILDAHEFERRFTEAIENERL